MNGASDLRPHATEGAPNDCNIITGWGAAGAGRTGTMNKNKRRRDRRAHDAATHCLGSLSCFINKLHLPAALMVIPSCSHRLHERRQVPRVGRHQVVRHFGGVAARASETFCSAHSDVHDAQRCDACGCHHLLNGPTIAVQSPSSSSCTAATHASPPPTPSHPPHRCSARRSCRSGGG